MSRLNANIPPVSQIQISPLKRFASDIFRYLPTRAIPAVAGVFGAFLVTRLISPIEYGSYSLSLAIVTPMVVLLTEWASQPIGRYLSEFKYSGKQDRYDSIVTFLLLVVLALGAIGACLLIMLGSRHWGMAMAAAAGFYLLLLAGANVLNPLFPANFDSRFYAIVQTLVPVLQIALGIVLILSVDAQAYWLMVAAVISSLILFSTYLMRARRHVQFRLDSLNRNDLRVFLSYGGPMLTWFIASQWLAMADRYFIGYFLSAADLGVYAANHSIAISLGGMLSAPIIIAASPIILRMAATGEEEGIARVVSNMTHLYAILALGLIGWIAACGKDITTLLLGPEFRNGYVVMLPLLIGIAVWNASMLGQKGLEIANKTLVMFAFALSAAAFNFIANAWAVPRFGITAAAYVTAASYCVYAVLIWLSSHRTIAWRIPWASVAAAATAALMAVMFLRILFSAEATLAMFFVKTVLYGMVFLAGIVASHWRTFRPLFSKVRNQICSATGPLERMP